MGKFRIDSIGDLSRQLGFTPHDARTHQVAAAEELLLELEASKAYPLEFIIFRITGYRPRLTDQTLLTGLALQHDLGLLIEQVCQTLDLYAEQSPQPVMTIDQVCQRFNVTSKTIQRWRRRGLPARRVIFADGKRRVGFLLGHVERFLSLHRDQALTSANFSQVREDEQDEILRRARRLAVLGGCCLPEICRRIAARLRRSPLTIGHVIATHDQGAPAAAIAPLAASSLNDEQRSDIVRGHRRHTSLNVLSRRMNRPRSTIYRVIVEERLARLNRRKVRFIDDPLYHQREADRVIQEIDSQDVLIGQKAEEARIPRDLPPYLRDLYRTPLLSPPRERALFLKLNFHKFQFVTARRKIEPLFARCRDIRLLEAHRRKVAETKNQIVRANLRLVVSVARKHLRPGLSLMELISDANLTLMSAVDSFDPHRGNRFSTYATLALMKGFARIVPRMQIARREFVGGDAMLGTLPDGRHCGIINRMLHREEVQHLLSRLDDRERDVIEAYYGLPGGRPATYEQVGARLGLSKQRVRQIEQAALVKLRAQGKQD